MFYFCLFFDHIICIRAVFLFSKFSEINGTLSTSWQICWANKTSNYWLFSRESCTKRGGSARANALKWRLRTLVTDYTLVPFLFALLSLPCLLVLGCLDNDDWSHGQGKGMKRGTEERKRGRLNRELTFDLAKMGFAHISWINRQKTTNVCVPLFARNSKKTWVIFFTYHNVYFLSDFHTFS